MSSDHLPEGWTVAKISDITIKGEQRKPSSEETFTYVDIGSIDRDRKCISSPQYLAGNNAPSRARKVIKTGDVLVSLTRPNLNAVALVPDELDNQIASTGFEVVKPLSVDSRFVFALTKSKDFIDSISGVVQGALYPAAKSSDVQAYTFQLPALAEQKVIADKLDTLLAQVETTKARLELIPEILKNFRQSVLADAVSGKLNAGDYQQAPVYKALGDVGVEVKTGPFGSALHKSEYISGGIPVINPMHISNGTIVASQQMTIPKAKYDELEAWHLKIGDVVVGRRGEMGRAAVVNYKGEMLCGTGSMILRTPKNSLPKYLEIILRSPLAVEYFTSNSVGSTMVNLNQKIIKSLQVHFPSQEEQTEIVRRVEKLFAYADKVEAQVKTAQARVNQLTQSILAKAFRGELTANWRAANPELIRGENSAEALLVIIKNERAKLSQTKKGRGKSVEN